MKRQFDRLVECGRWLEPVGITGFAVFLAALWVGLLTAEAGHFKAWLALPAGIVAGAIAWRCMARASAEGQPAGTPSWHLPAAVALALSSLAFTLPPAEWIMGGWDPGVYFHTAASLARHGSLWPDCPDLSALTAQERSLFGREEQETWAPFPGMRMAPDGRLSPQFFHLYPVLMALVWPFGGARAALLVNPLLNVVSIVALFLWARRWVHPIWALAAALVLALNPAQVWQARFGTSEMLTQVLLLGGLVLLGRAFSAGRAPRWREAFLAGAAFGLALLARYDTVLFVVPLTLILLTGLRNKTQRGSWFVLLGTVGALAIQAWLHQHFLAPFYHPMASWVAQGLLMTGILGVVILVFVLCKPRDEQTAIPAASSRWLPIAAAIIFVGWAIAFWYLRPRLGVNGHVLKVCTWLYPGLPKADWFPLLAGVHARNFMYLESLFGRPGLLMAMAGIIILMFRAEAAWKTAWLVGAIGALAVLMLFIFHEPFMMFAARRLIPVVIPLLCVGVAATCAIFQRWLRNRPRWGGMAAGFLLALAVVPPLGGTLFMATHRDWPGLVAWYARLAAQIPPGARVYSDQPGFAAPLRFVHGIRASELILVPDTQTNAVALMMKQARTEPVLWLTQFPVPHAFTNRFTPVGDILLDSSILGSERHAVPRYTRGRDGVFHLYRVSPDDKPGT